MTKQTVELKDKMIFCKDCAQIDPKKNPHPFCKWCSSLLTKELLEQPWICEGHTRRKQK